MNQAICSSTENSFSAAKATASKLRLGISLVYYGLVVAVSAFLAMLALPMFLQVDLFLLSKILKGLLVVIAGSWVLSLTGKCLCLANSRGIPGRLMLWLALACGFIATLITLAAMFVDLPPRVPASGNFLHLGGTGLFVLFLRSFAGLLGDESLKRRAVFVLVMGASTELMGLIPQLSGSDLAEFSPLFEFASFGFGLLAFFGYARLLAGMMNTLNV